MKERVIIIVRGVVGSSDQIQAWHKNVIERARAEQAATAAGKVDAMAAELVARVAQPKADSLDKRSVAAGMDALDALWESLPTVDAQEAGELWAPYRHVRYLLERLSALVPEITPKFADAMNRYDPAIAKRRLRELLGGYGERPHGI